MSDNDFKSWLELSSYSALETVIKIISDNIFLPSDIRHHLMKWGRTKHWLRIPTPEENKRSLYHQSFRKTFAMSDEEIVKRGVGTRQGDRSPSIKTRNLIIGWCAEEIVTCLLKKHIQVKSIELIGADSERVLVLTYTPTDPDLMLNLSNGKKLMVETVSISKETSDNKVRIKYNKIKQNEKRFFSLKQDWRDYYLVPTIYISVDMVSRNPSPFILGGEDFCGKKTPYPFGGWENQLVLEFDTINQRLNYRAIQGLNLISMQKRITNRVLSNNPYMAMLVKHYGNIHLVEDRKKKNQLKKFTALVARLSTKLDELNKKISYEKSDLKRIFEDMKSFEIDEIVLKKIINKIERDISTL